MNIMLKNASGEEFFVFDIKGLFFNEIKCDKERKYFDIYFFE